MRTNFVPWQPRKVVLGENRHRATFRDFDSQYIDLELHFKYGMLKGHTQAIRDAAEQTYYAICNIFELRPIRHPSDEDQFIKPV